MSTDHIPGNATATVRAERETCDAGHQHVVVWVTPTGDEQWQTIATLHGLHITILPHVCGMKVIEDSSVSVVYTLDPAQNTKEDVQALLDALAELGGLEVTETTYVEPDPQINPVMAGATATLDVIGGFLRALDKAARSRPGQPW